MDPLSVVSSIIAGGLAYLIPFLIVLTVVVFVHELGHFSVARLFGTRVETFSIGFGRALVSWTDRKGTAWKIGWLPLGGYVKFWGDENAASEPDAERLAQLRNDPQSAACFHFKPLWQKSLIVAAGPFANFIFAIVVFAALFSTYGVVSMPVKISAVAPDSAAAEAGIQPGDTVIAVDGVVIENFEEVYRAVISSDGRSLVFTLLRDGNTLTVTARPKRVESTLSFGNKAEVWQLGITAAQDVPREVRQLGPSEAVARGVQEAWFFIDRTFAFIGGLIAGWEDSRQLSGPLGIAKTSGEVATLGVVALVYLMAVLSVSIGLINLFPIPMLDGGHLLFYAAEAIRGRPLGENAQEIGFRLGLALMLSLMLFATWNDVLRIFGS